MKNTINLTLRTYPVVIEDQRHPGEVLEDTITLEKSQLQAAQVVGQSSKELIERLCDRQGYTVIEIGKPVKSSVVVDLDKLGEAGA